MRGRAAAAVLLSMLLLGAGAGSAATPSAALARLNEQRAQNGIPGGIVLVPAWSKACGLHNRYLKKNKTTGHGENKKKPGYTKDGAWAGKNAVLSYGDDWNTVNPWENAPIHLAQLLAPQLARIGIDDTDGYVCATTWPGYARRSAANVIYSYPGDRTSGWTPRQTARERPFVPGDFVKLPQGTETGLHLFVFADGPWLSSGDGPRLRSVSLTGPDGPVEVRSVDRASPKVGKYLPPGAAILIPVKPLRTNSAYTASVTLANGSASLARTWTFRTGAAANEVVVTAWRWRIGARLVVEVTFKSSAPGAVVTLETSAGVVLGKSAPVTSGNAATLDLAVTAVTLGTTYRICVHSGGAGTEFVEKRACVSLKL